MPPDRLQQSGDASTSRDPSSSSHRQRKLNRTLPQLKRNAACIPCRRRRIKCDAAKPHCSSCLRNFRFLSRTQPDKERDEAGVQCYYDEGDEEDYGPNGKQREGEGEGEDPREAVRRLEARVAQLQNRLASLTSPNENQDIPTGRLDMTEAVYAPLPGDPGLNVHPWSSFSLPLQYTPDVKQDYASKGDFGNGPVKQKATVGLVSTPHTKSSVHVTSIDDGEEEEEQFDTTTRAPVDADADAGRLGGPYLDILWPGWPPQLPTPTMVDHMVNTFFSVVPSTPRLLHRQRFQARLTLPPTHPDFPHPALLHAICAVAARYTAAVKVCSVAEMIERVNNEGMSALARGPSSHETVQEIARDPCFGERHSKFAFAAMAKDAHKQSGRKVMEIVQAQTLLSLYCQQNAKWVDGWTLFSVVGRATVPLGLQHDHIDDFQESRIITAVLPPPTEDWDREERRVLMAIAFAHDTLASCSSGWPAQICLDEVTTRLPAAAKDFDRGYAIPENTQTYRSTDIFSNHPVQDSFVMHMKGMLLLNKVSTYIRRVKLLSNEERAMQRQSPEFRWYEKAINDFHTTFPHQLRDPLRHREGKRVDVDSFSAQLVCNIASIHLHDLFANMDDPQDESAVKLLIAARSSLGLIYLITSSSTELSFFLIPMTTLYVLYLLRSDGSNFHAPSQGA
ncbi:hypothetical protein M231_00652 [Tremella mesenterica]|uniref:Zn(2)-C6 fungal-type domain-containing protein n=1 Tax=Tremella mesenterica TaxID=5217 RepID=A0A4Q1BUW2_TREME|nr:hypothetical protein M231_00652 [Tremella mesenterica]